MHLYIFAHKCKCTLYTPVNSYIGFFSARNTYGQFWICLEDDIAGRRSFLNFDGGKNSQIIHKREKEICFAIKEVVASIQRVIPPSISNK